MLQVSRTEQPPTPSLAVLTRRRRCAVARPHRVSVRLSAGEFAAVRTAAAGARLAVGAWIGDVACQVATGQAATGDPERLRTVLTELNRTRTQLARAGVLFNQVVAALHSAGVEEPRLTATAVYIAGRVRRVDEQVDVLVALLP